LKRILFDARWYGDHGIGRFAREVRKRLGDASEYTGDVRPYSPFDCVYSGLRLANERNTVFFSPGYNSPLGSHSFAFTIHDLAHIDNAESWHPLKSIYYELVMKPACARALRVFTVSEYSRGRIAEWAGLDVSRIINVSNGVNGSFSTVGERYQLDAPYVLVPGNRKPHKNEQRALRAFAGVHRGDGTKLVFMGDASPKLLALASELGLASRVEFLGPIDDARLAEVYRGAEVVLFASLYEGFGLPVIEGMACGTPVITSNVCSLPEVAGGAALLVEPDREDSIADALLTIKQDPTLRARLRELGLENVRRFSWERTGAKVRDAIAEVC
jgi:glycosyltransferase involved in cell wall biosynthesis